MVILVSVSSEKMIWELDSVCPQVHQWVTPPARDAHLSLPAEGGLTCPVCLVQVLQQTCCAF